MNLWWKKVYYLQTESQRHDNQLPPLLYPAGLSTRTLYIHDRCSRGSCDHCRDWRPGSNHLGRLCRWCHHGKLCWLLLSFRGFWESFVMDSSIWNNVKGLYRIHTFFNAQCLLNKQEIQCLWSFFYKTVLILLKSIKEYRWVEGFHLSLISRQIYIMFIIILFLSN